MVHRGLEMLPGLVVEQAAAPGLGLRLDRRRRRVVQRRRRGGDAEGLGVPDGPDEGGQTRERLLHHLGRLFGAPRTRRGGRSFFSKLPTLWLHTSTYLPFFPRRFFPLKIWVTYPRSRPHPTGQQSS